RPMASVTTRPPDAHDLARVAPETIAVPLLSAPTTVRIEPPRGWLELHLHYAPQQPGRGLRFCHRFGFCPPTSRTYPPYRRDTRGLSQCWLFLRQYADREGCVDWDTVPGQCRCF